jgi:exosortase
LAVARHRRPNQHGSVTGREDSPRLPTAAKINLVAVALLAGALSVHLWPEWSHDADLSHGFLTPVACGLLLYLCRFPDRRSAPGPGTAVALTASLGVAALLVLWVAGLFAATLDWTSPLVDFALACSFALLGGAAIGAFADRRLALIPFAWASVAAAVVWPLSAPIPPGTYSRLTSALQQWVAGAVVHALGLLGIAAHREGTLIELARGTVGIEEACSGVRSLVSCVFAGVLISAALTRRPGARVLIIALSAPLALAMNFVRSLLLTLLVNAGVPIEGAWHDVTGYLVLVATAFILFCGAVLLDRRARPERPASPQGPPPDPAPSVPGAQAVLTGVLALVFATLAFFVAGTAPSARQDLAAPDLLAILPATARGWYVTTSPGLYRFTGTLRTDRLAQRTYTREDAGGEEQVTLYLAYWSPGQASVGLVGAHTPDACWPGAGWTAKPVADPHAVIAVGDGALPPAEHRAFVNQGYPQQVWFWHLYNGRAIDTGDPFSLQAHLRTALRFGFRNSDAAQAFVRISSNRPWDEIAREPLVIEFLQRARTLGLREAGPDPRHG